VSSEGKQQHINCKLVHDILRKTLRHNAKLPSVNHSSVVDMAHFLDFLRIQKNEAAGPSTQYRNCQTVAAAILSLTEKLPPLREHYVANFADAEPVNSNDAQPAKQTLAAFDALVTAAQTAHDRGLINQISMLGCATLLRPTGWRELAAEIKLEFGRNFPNASKETTYRFISAIIPHVTGEKGPSHAAVKIECLRNQ
jgi:hypothetical protein